MAIFKPHAPADLKMLQAGMCPECGAALSGGVKACGVCKVQFTEEHAALIGGARKAAPGPAAAGPARPLTAEEIDDLERGPLHRGFPLSVAGAADVADGKPVALGVALSAALIVYADAALVDEPAVLMGAAAPHAPIPRVRVNVPGSAAALADDGPLGASASPPAPARAAPAAAPPPPPGAVAPPPAAVAPPPPPPPPGALPAVAAHDAPTQPDHPVTGVDPDATMQHNADDIAAVIDEIAGGRKPVAKGRARALDD